MRGWLLLVGVEAAFRPESDEQKKLDAITKIVSEKKNEESQMERAKKPEEHGDGTVYDEKKQSDDIQKYREDYPGRMGEAKNGHYEPQNPPTPKEKPGHVISEATLRNMQKPVHDQIAAKFKDLAKIKRVEDRLLAQAEGVDSSDDDILQIPEDEMPESIEKEWSDQGPLGWDPKPGEADEPAKLSPDQQFEKEAANIKEQVKKDHDTLIRHGEPFGAAQMRKFDMIDDDSEPEVAEEARSRQRQQAEEEEQDVDSSEKAAEMEMERAQQGSGG